jgi:hypothetical protein
MSECECGTRFSLQSSSCLEDLLNSNSNYYIVLFFLGNLDVSTNIIAINEVLEGLAWDGSEEFNEKAERVIWKDGNIQVSWLY